MKKSIFETPHSEMKCVKSIKESNFNAKNGLKFSHFLTVRTGGADPSPPLTINQPDCKTSVFYNFPKSDILLFESLP